MIRKIICVCVLLFTVNVVASPIFPISSEYHATQQCTVTSDTVSNFCDLFKSAVTSCSPLPLSMHALYSMMITVYGTLQTACNKQASQYGSDPQTCVDQWNCYWNGGKDSKGGLCSGTGKLCEQYNA